MFGAFQHLLSSVENGAAAELLCGFYHCFCQMFDCEFKASSLKGKMQWNI